MSNFQHYALVGFANSGKSTLFNLLSGDKQKVGNWSGVTVSAKQKSITLPSHDATLSDLPGLSSLTKRDQQGQDLTISHDFLRDNDIDCLVNVVDATQLQRQLYLTTQLLELGVPMIVLLNKTDRTESLDVDVNSLSQLLGCPVHEISAQNKDYLSRIQHALTSASNTDEHYIVKSHQPIEAIDVIHQRHDFVRSLLENATKERLERRSITDRLDDVVLHPLVGIPVFLGMMYLLFMFAINVGSAFIDFFDILSGTIFVDYPLHWLSSYDLPAWLLTLVEGVGSGIQTVATFIPVIVCLFIGLSLLESSGYLARAAFVVDSVMQKIGLPGKAFVPLIVGFGCTVPAVMSARVLDSERERITTVMMAPFMSCGARLPVYALFAAAFFPDNGQNLVFLLYLVGIAAAIFTGFLLKKTTLPGTSSINIMELPLYEMPKLTDISARVYQRTKSFVTGAGKTIVIVVCVLNFFNSIGTDGQFGHQDSEQSVLSEGAKLVMPVLAPMGVKEENWQAGVGIITGIFAKEVLVATFNSLYSPHGEEEGGQPSLSESWQEATDKIKENLLGIEAQDPLGIDVGEVSDLNVASQEQEVELNTYHVMQQAFDGQLGAFSYLLFILLYTPCVAAMGAIKNEVGTRWAGFAGAWSFALAYLAATFCYQLGNILITPVVSSFALVVVLLVFYLIYRILKSYGNKILTIPISVKYS
ncbi:ferrous iron transport protein B [Thalassotalea sp. PLHSN55]|uniref:ferrous iron transport protein B n=1 Tax=Thalassotalea sp. PLHSN55 TaxID=3435888 RepID=UPI003F86966E